MSIAANAAALNWSTWGYINDGEAASDWIDGGQAYLVMVTDTANFAVADDLTVTGGEIVDSAALGGGTVFGVWQGTDSLVDGTTYKFAVIATTDGAGSDVPTSGTYGVDDGNRLCPKNSNSLSNCTLLHAYCTFREPKSRIYQ